MAVIALSLAGLASSQVGAHAAGSITVSPGEYVGGGTINVIARSSAGAFVAGGDTQGFYRSTNGTDWASSNDGISNTTNLRVAALTVADVGSQTRWFAGVGNATNGSPNAGVVLVSTNNGASWQEMPGSPAFQGANAKSSGVPETHPRSVGNLLGVTTDASGASYLIAGSFVSGLERCRLDPGTATACVGGWQEIGLANKHIRSIAFGGSASSRNVYAAVYGEGVYLVKNALGTVSAAARYTDASAPTGVEEMGVRSGVLVTAGLNGLAVIADGAASGAVWSKPAGNPDANFIYTSLGLRVSGDSVVATLGVCNQCNATEKRDGTTGYAIEEYAINATTRAVTGRTDRTGSKGTYFVGHPTMPFWLDSSVQITRGSWIGSDFLQVGTDMYATGRGGIYRSSMTDPIPTWSPAHYGAPAMFARTLALRGSGGTDALAVTDADWLLAETATGLTAITSPDVPKSSVSGDKAGFGTVWSENTAGAQLSDLVVTTGVQKLPGGGKLGVRQGSGSFEDWPLPNDSRPLAVAAKTGYVSAGTVTVATWLEDSGLWFKTGKTGTAAKASSTPTTTASEMTTALNSAGPTDVHLVWASGAAGTDAIFVSAPTGVWRYKWPGTNFAGGSWAKVTLPGDLGSTSYKDLAGKGVGSGFTLWTVADGKAFKATGAATATSPAFGASVANVPNAVAISAARSVDKIAVATKAQGAAQPALWTFASTGAGLTNVVSGNAKYQGQGRFPQDLALSGDGLRAYVSTEGQGVVFVSGL